MSGNRVWETSTTTGTGDLTLAGAETDYITFNNGPGQSKRFTYNIQVQGSSVFETGIGYLSASTTLVRERVLENSSGTFVTLSLASGTKDVTIGASTTNTILPSSGFSSLGSAAKFIRSSHVTRPNSTHSTTADRIHWSGFRIQDPVVVDSIGIAITSGAGTGSNLLHLGLYDTDPNTGDPGFLLFSVTDLDPSSSGIITSTFTEQELDPGTYWFAYWSDTTPTIRANDGTITTSVGNSIVNSTNLNNIGWVYINGQSSLSDLPATGNANNAVTGAQAWPIGIIGHS